MLPRSQNFVNVAGFLIYIYISYLLAKYGGPIVIMSLDDPGIMVVYNENNVSYHTEEPYYSDILQQINQIESPPVQDKYEAEMVLKWRARKIRIVSVCKKYNIESLMTGAEEYLKHIVVNDKKKILFCSTLDMRNAVLHVFLNKNDGAQSEEPGNVQEKVKYLYNLEAKGIKERLSNYTKVIVVQNPLSRLLKSYFDKLNSSSDIAASKNKEMHTHKHLSLDRTSRLKHKHAGKFDTLTDYLQQFVDGRKDRQVIDEQFMTYRELCGPCEVSYDYVLYDSVSNDELRAIGYRLNININRELPQRYAQSVTDDFSMLDSDVSFLLKTYYKDVPSALRKQVSDKIRVDASMFGYAEDTRYMYKYTP